LDEPQSLYDSREQLGHSVNGGADDDAHTPRRSSDRAASVSTATAITPTSSALPSSWDSPLPTRRAATAYESRHVNTSPDLNAPAVPREWISLVRRMINLMEERVCIFEFILFHLSLSPS
jgi:hypothetical protein